MKQDILIMPDLPVFSELSADFRLSAVIRALIQRYYPVIEEQMKPFKHLKSKKRNLRLYKAEQKMLANHKKLGYTSVSEFARDMIKRALVDGLLTESELIDEELKNILNDKGMRSPHDKPEQTEAA